MNNMWKLHGGTPDKSKSANELALANLTNLGRGEIKGEFWNCRKTGHNNEDCTVKEKDKDNKNKNKANKYCGGGNKKHCGHCGCGGHAGPNLMVVSYLEVVVLSVGWLG